MKLKERLRIAWQVLTKGTCDELMEANELMKLNNPNSSYYIPGLGDRRIETYRFVYTAYSEREGLSSDDAERLALKEISKQILRDRAFRNPGIDRLDKPAPYRREYILDVLLPGKYHDRY